MALSTYPGGAADKAGFFHESLWAIRCMLEVVDGKAESIRIETPGEDGAEFYLQRGFTREHWQVKRQVTGQETWTLVKLKDVLEFFLSKVRRGESCVFASVSDAPDLRMLTENAQATKKAGEGLAEFKRNFLDKKRATQFADLQALVEAVSEEETFAFLCAVTIHGGREVTLEPEFSFRLEVMFQGPSQTTMAALRDLFLRSTHESLNAAQMEEYLETRGIARRRGGMPESRERILAVTEAFVAGLQAKLICGALIRRSVAESVVAKLQEGTDSQDLLLTSPAGGGKSACMFQIVSELQTAGVPVLAFRLDRVEPVPTALLLGERLGLGESPAIVLSNAFPEQPVVLLVDQLDCVSTTSGRNPDFFDTIAALHAEVLGLRTQRTIHLIFACRKFDFDHDHRLKQLTTKEQPPFELKEFTDNEVKAVLVAEGGDYAGLTSRQRAMLRLPQNLSLYVDAGLATTGNQFSTPKELCDAYWTEKRKAVSIDRPNFAQYWLPVIQSLARVMSDREELSVPGREMDEFPPEFLQRLASEGVLTWDKRRYGFGHETFFDYCFARTLPNGGRDFIQFLETDMQHLFRRAQLRQVLAFLRDDDFSAYLASVENLLRNGKIRPHLKLLAVELLAAHPQVRDEELNLLVPWVEDELKFCGRADANPDKLTSRVWERIFVSRSLFPVVDRIGLLQRWMKSGVAALEDMVARYIRWQTDEHAERIAELLEPFFGISEWRERFRYIMEGRNLEKSRRLFELFLRLLKAGDLDDAKDRFASNGTFWSMLHGLSSDRPDWCSEVAAVWLDRQIMRASVERDPARSLRNLLNDQFGVDDLFESARRNPSAFLKSVLPAVCQAAATLSFGDSALELPRDQLWPSRFQSDYVGILEAFPAACETAFDLLGKDAPEGLRPYIELLRPLRLYTANHLLMSAYLAAPVMFADEALSLLTDETGRLNCGYSDSAHWHARKVIEECSPLCGEQVFRRFEATILGYVTAYEKSREGFRFRGHAAYNLATALPKERIGNALRSQLAEWEEKYKKPDGPPRGIRVYTVGSPIEEEPARLMTDEQWLGAIAKYDTEERTHDFDHPERGGALELARMLQKFTEEQPERFAKLALQFPAATHPYYLSHVLGGLKKTGISSGLKLDVARLVFPVDYYDCFQRALNVLSSITDFELPIDAIDYIRRAAIHPNPKSEEWDGETPYYGGDILTAGLNCVRGSAAGAVRDLVFANDRYISLFSETIDRLVSDPSLAVRAIVASTLLAVASHDSTLAVNWTHKLLDVDDRLLTTHYVQDLLNRGLRDHFADFSETLKRMLQSSVEKVRRAGGTLSCLARYYHQEADSLSDAALHGDELCRLGACEVAKENILNSRFREWCEAALTQMFVDPSKEVREKAAGCFWHLWQSPEIPLFEFDALIRSFVQSQAFTDEPTFLLHALEETKQRVPEAVLDVCEAFIARCSAEARDIRTSMAGDEITIGKLVFTAYAQLQAQPLQSRALDLIDRMSLEGLSSAGQHLSEFER